MLDKDKLYSVHLAQTKRVVSLCQYPNMIFLILLIVHKTQIYLQRKAQISSWGHFIDRGPGYAFKSSLIISFAEVFISKLCKSLLEISSVYVHLCTFQCKLVPPQSKQSLAMRNYRSNLRT